MSDEQRKNLLKGTGDGADFSCYKASFDTTEPMVVGRQYTLSLCVDEVTNTGVDNPRIATFDGAGWWNAGDIYGTGYKSLTFTYAQPYEDHSDANTVNLYNYPEVSGATRRVRLHDLMLVEGDTPAAWAPAEGETLAGGGALMSANLLADANLTIPYPSYASENDGVITSTARDMWYNVAEWYVTLDPVTENQTVHASVSMKWHGAAATKGVAYMSVAYKDANGWDNVVDVVINGITTEWKRFEMTCVVPSGMTVDHLHVSSANLDAAYDVTAPCMSYGSPVSLAVASHTTYATEGHLVAKYATQASLKVQSDRITSEVSARAQTDKAVSDLSTRVTQTESGITTEISDRKTAVSNAQTAAVKDANANTLNALKSYTKTADLAATDAVKAAKKAGTDAQATANATATLIRQYSDGVLVCKTGKSVGALVSANGSFDVVTVTWDGSTPKAGTAIASFDGDSIDLGGQTSAVNMCGGTGMVTLDKISNQIAIGGERGAYLQDINGIKNGSDQGIGYLYVDGKGEASIVADSLRLNSTQAMPEGWRELLAGGAWYARFGGCVVVQILNISMSSAGYRTIGTLPTGYRPRSAFRGTDAGIAFCTSEQQMGYIYIGTDGLVRMYANASGDYSGQAIAPLGI